MPVKDSILFCPDLDQDGFIKWAGGIAQSDRLTLAYCPMDLIPYWEENFKKHDIGGIWAAIAKYGFRDPFSWDKQLNDGQGGIVEGNGRREALEHGFNAGQPAPRGIIVKDGRWYAPLLIGVDARHEREAIAYGIDHNALTAKGGNFSAIDISRLFEQDEYLKALEDLAQFDALPVAIDGDDLDFLLNYEENQIPVEEGDRESSTQEIDVDAYEFDCKCPKCGFEFLKKVK